MDISKHENIVKAFDHVKQVLPTGRGLWGLLNNAGKCTVVLLKVRVYVGAHFCYRAPVLGHICMFIDSKVV